MGAMQRRVIRATASGWDGVAVEGYRPGDDPGGTGVSRHTIVGGRKGATADPGPAMELRYFELQPGAASRLEKHEHEHYVIVRCGDGYAIVGDAVSEVGEGDVVYVGALELHQFVNRGERPFGFYCVVDACRDFSQLPTDDDLARLAASPAGTVAKPFAVPPPRPSS